MGWSSRERVVTPRGLAPRVVSLALGLALGLAGAVAGCGGSESGRCTPGMKWVCPCGDGTMGQQVCGADGVYGECYCPGTGSDAAAVDGPRSDGGVAADAPAQ